MKRALIAIAIVLLLLLAGGLVFRHFAMYHTLDRDGMENPNYAEDAEAFPD